MQKADWREVLVAGLAMLLVAHIGLIGLGLSALLVYHSSGNLTTWVTAACVGLVGLGGFLCSRNPFGYRVLPVCCAIPYLLVAKEMVAPSLFRLPGFELFISPALFVSYILLVGFLNKLGLKFGDKRLCRHTKVIRWTFIVAFVSIFLNFGFLMEPQGSTTIGSFALNLLMCSMVVWGCGSFLFALGRAVQVVQHGENAKAVDPVSL